MKNILVIKLGALGDFVQALGPMQAIRNHHAGARITLLTTKPYKDLARASGYFDDIWTDDKPKVLQVSGWLALRRRLRGGHFSRVYDLQTSDRSGFYYKLLGPAPRPEWSGIVPGCSHPDDNPKRDFIHTVLRQRIQLNKAGIENVPEPDLSWLDRDANRFALEKPYVLLVTGGAMHRMDKRWGLEKYRVVADSLLDQGMHPVLIGGKAETEYLVGFTEHCPGVVNLCGQTDLLDIAALARAAKMAVGNDTGPMHLISAVGCPSLVLYSQASNPELCGQLGRAVEIVQVPDLNQLESKEVMVRIHGLMATAGA